MTEPQDAPHPARMWGTWRRRALPAGDWTMRTGKKVGRNLYIEWPDGRSEPVGQVDTASMAALIVAAVNEYNKPSPAPMFQNNFGGDVGNHIQGDNVVIDLS